MGQTEMTAMQGRLTLRLLAAVGFAATLAGCYQKTPVTAEYPVDYRQRHPIVLREGVQDVEVMETQAIGIPLGEACSKLHERTPVPEANFFGIVVAIQQKAGGNLSEALGNLSKVLRDRKKMRAKIQAMSQEAKASAAIIGALPIIVMVLVYLTSPKYITLLFTDPTGNVMLAGSAVWMTMGVLVMKKMINFDF